MYLIELSAKYCSYKIYYITFKPPSHHFQSCFDLGNSAWWHKFYIIRCYVTSFNHWEHGLQLHVKGKKFQPQNKIYYHFPQNLMIMEQSDIIDYYPVNFKTDLNGKQQEWEAVVLIPFIDEVSMSSKVGMHKVTRQVFVTSCSVWAAS